ncbi:MAG: metallophosphoesterase [Bacteroidetes bacterium]|uniref:Metallophosphoesterase n=1 Tax=Candidatus Cryptobacteroides merdigallinarum TaxID=2840770 RepID=A0A9D9EJZ2_9BACT|nr:metallophosphoesterase [Candidatus Cryptobacteroides merdigallinarum]
MRKLILTAALAGLCMAAAAQDLVILHTNDTHSHIDPVRSGEYAGLGGVIERAAYVDSVRAAMGRNRVLLVDAGDFSQGTSYFTLMKGDVETACMNAMRYDVACLGNHEFDNGLDELARRIESLDFPVVCANYDFDHEKLGKLVKPWCILRRGGFRIGVIGVLTDLTVVVDRKIADKMKYLDPVETVSKYADFLKNRKKCDLVICLSHLGYEGDFFTDPELVAGVENVDMVIGGHSHTFLEKAEMVRDRSGKEVPVVTDGCWGLYIGKITLGE